MVPTRFACRNVLFKMEIRDCLDELVGEMNFKSLSTMEYFTYTSLTRQFLTFVTHLVEDSLFGSGRIQFKSGQNLYSLTYEKFLDIYGIVGDTYRTSPIFCGETLPMTTSITPVCVRSQGVRILQFVMP